MDDTPDAEAGVSDPRLDSRCCEDCLRLIFTCMRWRCLVTFSIRSRNCLRHFLGSGTAFRKVLSAARDYTSSGLTTTTHDERRRRSLPHFLEKAKQLCHVSAVAPSKNGGSSSIGSAATPDVVVVVPLLLWLSLLPRDEKYELPLPLLHARQSCESRENDRRLFGRDASFTCAC